MFSNQNLSELQEMMYYLYQISICFPISPFVRKQMQVFSFAWLLLQLNTILNVTSTWKLMVAIAASWYNKTLIILY